MAIYLTELDSRHVFPSPFEALDEPNGLLAFGGDLSPQRIIAGYHNGIFPWYGPGEPILWWSPAPRAVFNPKTFIPAKSLKKFQRKHQYRISINRATDQVIEQCGAVRPIEETWLDENMQSAYQELARQGHCHSVEVWNGEHLIGAFTAFRSANFFVANLCLA